MDVTRWKSILFEWVKKTQLIDATGTLEHFDIQSFFAAFQSKIDPESKQTLTDFLAENFPDFEVLYDEENNISSQDSMYMFSLFLYYSCVAKSTSFFQKCCQSLNGRQQPALCKFFADVKLAFEDKRPVTKEVLRCAIRDSVLSPIATQNFTSSSPIRTPDKCIQTPSRNIYLQRSKELQKTKTMLENERYERTVLENELKQSETTVQALTKEKLSLKQEIKRLQDEMIWDKGQENLSPNKAIRDEQIRSRMQKEIDTREETIVNLRCEIEALTAQNGKANNKICLMDKEMMDLRHKIDEMDLAIEELRSDSGEKTSYILILEEKTNELQSFINETRKNSTPNKDRDMSSDYHDATCSTINTVSNSSDSGENLAKGLIDLQLREQELENQKLQEMFEVVNSEKEALDEALLAHGETITALQKRIKEQGLCTEGLRVDIQDLTAQLVTAKKENEELQSSMAVSKAELKSAEEQRKDQEAELKDVKVKLEVTESQCLELEKKYSSTVSEMKSTIENLETIAAARDAASSEMAAQIDNLTTRKQELEAEITFAENQRLEVIQNLTAQLDVARKENDALRSSMAEKQAEIEVLTSNYEAHRNEVEKEIESAKESRREMDELLKLNQATLEDMLLQFENQKSTHSKQVEELEADISSTTAELKSMKDNIDALKAAHRVEIETIHEKQRQDLTVLMAAKDVELMKVQDTLQAKITEAEKTRKLMEESLQSKMNRWLESTHRIEELEEEIAGQLRQIESLETLVEKIEHEKSNLIRDQRQCTDDLKADHQDLILQLDIAKADIKSAENQRTELETKLEEIQAQLETITSQHSAAKKENDELQSSMAVLKVEARAAEDQRKDLEAELKDVKVDLEVTESQYSELQKVHSTAVLEMKSTIESLEATLVARDAAASEMAAQIDNLMTRKQELEATITSAENQRFTEVSKLTAELDTLKKEKYQLQSSMVASQANVELEVKAAEARISGLESELKAAEEKRNNLEATLSDVKVKLEVTESQCLELEKKYTTAVSEMKSMIESLEATVAERDAAASVMVAEIDRFTTRKQELEAEIVASENQKVAEIEKLLAELETLKKEKGELHSSLVTSQASVESNAKTAEVQREELATKLKDVRTQLEAYTSQHSELEIKHAAIISEMKTTIGSLEATVAAKESAAREMVAQIDTLKAHEHQLEANITVAESQRRVDIQDLTAQLDTAKKENEQLQSSMAISMAELKAADDQRKNLEAELKDVRIKLEVTESQCLELEKKNSSTVSEMKTMIEGLEATVAAKQSAVEEMVTRIDSLKEREQQLEAKITAAENQRVTEIEKLTSQLDTLKKEKDELHSSVIASQANVELEVKAAEHKLLDLESKLEEVKSQLEVTAAQRSELESKHSIVVTEMKKTIESLQATIAANEIVIAETFTQIESAKKEKDDLKSLTAASKAEAQAAEVQRKELEAKLEEVLVQLEDTTSQHSEFEKKQSALVSEMKSTIETLEATVAARDSAVLDKVSEIDDLKATHQQQIRTLEHKLEMKTAAVDNDRVKELLKKVEDFKDLEVKVETLETEHLREKFFNDKLNKDVTVMNAKLMKEREAKNILTKSIDELKKKHETEYLEMKRKCEAEVKETRLEMEGKLEKMKEKMKSLYNEEVAKKKQSYETSLKENRDQIMRLMEKLGNLEGQTSILQNDKKKLQEENTFLQSKLRFLEKNGSTQMTGSIGMSRPSTMSQMNVANFGMEDEAGEMFNNTFLADLKSGGSLNSIDKNNDYNAAELQRRNSAYPIALRSSYAVVNTDINLGEQEMRDGFILDDSQAALLQSGNRKKQSTSYKRPGPPTPSKNAGRLSIGGSEINYNNILKENKNSENTKNTPGRIKSFFMGKGNSNSESERTPSRRRSRSQTTLRRRKEQLDDSDEEPAVNLDRKEAQRKEAERKEKRRQLLDQNRPDINEIHGSPAYERLHIDDDYDGWSEGEERSSRSSRPRNLDDSLEYQKNLEDWQQDRSRARHSRFSNQRRASSESVRQRSIREVIQGKDSGINEDLFQSCASLRSKHDSSDELRNPIKSVTRNFFETHHDSVNRMSDIYVPPAKQDLVFKGTPGNRDSNMTTNMTIWIVIGIILAAFYFVALK